MNSLAAELGYKEIISAKTAVTIRKYIESKNPQLSNVRRAGIFADAVNKIVDGRLSCFNDELANRLKQHLFRDTAQKSAFSIDCSDIFVSAIKLKNMSPDFISTLRQWLWDTAERNVEIESLSGFVRDAHSLLEREPDANITDIFMTWERETASLMQDKPAEEKNAFDTPADGSFHDIETESSSWDEKCEKIHGMDTLPAEISEMPACTEAGCKNTLLAAALDRFSRLRMSQKVLASAASCIIILFTVACTGVIFAGAEENNKEAGVIAESMYPASTEAVNMLSVEENTNAAGQAASDLSASAAGGRRMKATAYDLSIESCGKSPKHPQYGITSSGARAAVGRTVAVDPSIIPLGTRLQITFPPEYSELDGVYVAEDTGRLIKGEVIDVFFGEDRPGSRKVYESAMKFGVRYVEVKVLD